MSTVANPHEESRDFALGDWVADTIAYAIGLVVVVAAAAFALNMTWNELAGAFSFLNPIGGYWTSALVVLGAYVAFAVLDMARSHAVADLFEDSGGAIDMATRLALAAGLAFGITEYLA